tara:strand:+ start:88 stop:756 length:669 start_codon:yes stop_codon:yes gene_type:complete
MVNLIDHIAKNIQEIADTQLNMQTNNVEEAISASINEISSLMNQLGLNQNIIDDLKSNLTKNFENNIKEGLSSTEAFKETFDSIDTFLKSSMSSNSKINNDDEISNTYNLDFANSSQSDNSLLIDQAMAKGLSLSEAVKYVNNTIKQNGEHTYGPPAYADSKSEDNMNIVSSDQEKNLDKLNVDMNDQASKIFNNNTLENDSSVDESNSQSLNDNSEDEASS